jgi:MFS family permease
MLFRKDELKLLGPFYLSIFSFGLSSMVGPFMTIYYIHLGFSFFQISIITSAFGLSMFIFEIPTGAFADLISRKYSVILGYLIAAIAISTVPFVSNFYVMVSLWAVVGFGLTFSSGAEEAWVIGNLNKKDRIDLHNEYFVKGSSFRAFGAIFSPIIAAILVRNYSVTVLWYIYGLGYLVSAIILLFFTQELSKPQKTERKELIKKTFNTGKKGLIFCFRNRPIFLFSLATLFTYLMASAAAAHQPFFLSLGMPEYKLGYLFSIIGVINVITPFISRYIVKYNTKNVISISILFRVILQFSFLFIYPPFFLVASVIFITNKGILMFENPVTQTSIHKLIPGPIRATTLSAISMTTQIIMIISTLIAGYFLDLYGPRKVIALMALFGILAIFTFQKIKELDYRKQLK